MRTAPDVGDGRLFFERNDVDTDTLVTLAYAHAGTSVASESLGGAVSGVVSWIYDSRMLVANHIPVIQR